MVERRITTQDVENRLDRVVKEVSDSPDAYIVVTDGPEQAAVISLERYRELIADEQRRRVEEATRLWDEVVASVGNRNADLSEAEIEEMSVRFSREFAEELFAEGKVRYAPETPE